MRIYHVYQYEESSWAPVLERMRTYTDETAASGHWNPAKPA
jgi:hypothetical protein